MSTTSNSFTFTLDAINQAASFVLNHLQGQKIVVLNGDMGAGKTTLTKAICQQLGSTDHVTSPTFALVNEYLHPTARIFHFDFYRIKTPTEALDMGCEEYFYSGAYCFIEWAQRVANYLPMHYTEINIDILPNGQRKITLRDI